MDRFVRDAENRISRAEFTGSAADYAGKWTHLVAVVDREGDKLVVYVNGSAQPSAALTTGSVSGPRSLCFGEAGVAMQGYLDEPRVHDAARSPAWIKTSYDNVATPDMFMQISLPML